jgi:uncharacterized protein
LTVSPSGDVSLRLETVSGALVNPTDPQAEDICLDDIAWGLSRIPRFMGHTITEVPYNVAQHSVYVSELVEDALNNGHKFADMPGWQSHVLNWLGHSLSVEGRAELLTLALLHDAHEAYLGDLPSPIKRIPELQETLRLMEQKFDHAIRTKFGLPEPMEATRQVIHFFDKLAQAIEGYQFMRSRGVNWKLPRPTLELLQQFPAPKPALESYQDFVSRFEFLWEQMSLSDPL